MPARPFLQEGLAPTGRLLRGQPDPHFVHGLGAFPLHRKGRFTADHLDQHGGERVPLECVNQAVQHCARDKPSLRSAEDQRNDADRPARDLDGPRSLSADLLHELSRLLSNGGESLVNDSH